MSRRLFSILMAILTAVSIAACGKENPASTGGGEAAQAADSAPASTACTLSGRPVAAAGDTFILQDETTEKYGLADSGGSEVLPAGYDDMYYLQVNPEQPKTYLAVQDKGSYGVFDLEGNTPVTPYYDDIQAAAYGDFFVTAYRDQYGLVNPAGEELLGAEYVQIAVSVEQNIAALKVENDGYTLYLFDKNMSPMGSWATDIPSSSEINLFRFSDDGQAVCAQERRGSRVETGKWYQLNGTALTGADIITAAMGSTVNYPYLAYAKGGQLTVEDVRTGAALWTAPVTETPGAGWYVTMSKLRNASPDAASFSISVTGVTSNLQEVTYSASFILTLGQTAAGFSPEEKGINGESVVSFCDGTAFALSSDNQLLVIDTAGNTVSQLKVPFSDTSPTLMDKCAVLNNNDYWYVIDKNGETLSPEEGYTGRRTTIQALITPDNYIEIIDRNGEYMITKDSMISKDQVADSSNSAFKSLELQGQYTPTFYLAAIYDAAKDRYHIFDYKANAELGDETTVDASLGQALFDGSGFVFLGQDGQALYGAVGTGEGYTVRLISDSID